MSHFIEALREASSTSPIAQQLLRHGAPFLFEHGTTIMVSTVVFSLLSMIQAVLMSGPKKRSVKASQSPQPKWVVLKFLNYVVVAVFVGSVTYTVSNYRGSVAQQGGASLITSIRFPMMVLWGMCLVYFFGFFGISFLDTEEIVEFQQVAAAAASAKQDKGHSIRSPVAPLSNQFPTPKPVAKSQQKVMNDGPICSDPAGRADVSSEPVNIEEVDFTMLDDDEVFEHLLSGALKDYQLEKKLDDCGRAVALRRRLYENVLDQKLDLIPHDGYDYGKVFGANCEIVIGYVPLPLGVVGPLVINGEPIYIPMATTEGCLVASTNRGCKAINSAGGCSAMLLKDGITRAPCVRFPSAMRAAACKMWVETPDNYLRLEEAFNSTTNYGRLEGLDATLAGRNVYLRFLCMSGDAMGMNMVSKGCLKAIEILQDEFPDLDLVAISGNMCTDKKPAAINWILGRGKSIVVEAVIPERVVKTVLKSSVHDMIETNKQKNHIGSAMAGSIGGFNAHAANIVTAVFLATGQDPAQNVESSNCLTIMEYADDGKSLHVSVTMPSIEVGTVGGGTHLPAQAGCLEICGVRGAAKGSGSQPGDNSRKLAQIVGSAVLAGELSLMAALAANHLVRSHMQHNRKPQEAPATVHAPSAAEVHASVLRKNESMPVLTSHSLSPNRL